MINKIFNKFKKHNNMITQFIMYIIANIIALIIHYSVLIYLANIHHMNAIFASNCGFLIGAIVAFYLNKILVFKTINKFQKFTGLKYFFLVGLNSLLNMLFLWILINILNLYYLFAQVITTIALIMWNFYCCKLWIFTHDTKCSY